MRLADQRSPCCGAPLEGMTKGQGSKTKGRAYLKCVLDGRKTLYPLRPPREWKPRHANADQTGKTWAAGEPCCWFHEPIPADKPTGWPQPYRDDDDTAGKAEWAEYDKWKADCRKRPELVDALPGVRREGEAQSG